MREKRQLGNNSPYPPTPLYCIVPPVLLTMAPTTEVRLRDQTLAKAKARVYRWRQVVMSLIKRRVVIPNNTTVLLNKALYHSCVIEITFRSMGNVKTVKKRDKIFRMYCK